MAFEGWIFVNSFSYLSHQLTLRNSSNPENKFRMILVPSAAHHIPNGTLLHHPNRDSHLPNLYVVNEHPLVDRSKISAQSQGRIIIYVQNTSENVMRALAVFEDTLKIPLGPNQLMDEQGLFALLNDDIIFARQLKDGILASPENDVVQAWVCDGRMIVAPSVIQELEKIQADILGDTTLISKDRPFKNNNGVYVGGTHFERNDWIHGVKGTRCYTIGPSHQHSKSVVSPNACGKVMDEIMNDDHHLRHRLLKYGGILGMKSLEHFAPYLIPLLTRHAELTNMPRVGIKDNVAYPTMQLNMAPAVSHQECYTCGLQGMGEFGYSHIDRHDDPGGMSCMISYSYVPHDEEYEWGRFHLLTLGCYIVLDPFRVMNFSGLRRHGGTPPLSPPGKKPVPFAYRLMTVLYPPSSMLSGAGKHLIDLATLNGIEPFSVTPEMTTVSDNSYEIIPSCNRSNWAKDGQVLLDDLDLFNLFVRFLTLVCVFFLRQLPLRFNARIDTKKFAAAFSMAANVNRDTNTSSDINSRVYATYWEYAPTGYTRHPTAPRDNTDEMMTDEDKRVKILRDDAVKEWKLVQQKFLKFMPSQMNRILEGQSLTADINPNPKYRRPVTGGSKRPYDTDTVRKAKRLRVIQEKGPVPPSQFPYAALPGFSHRFENFRSFRVNQQFNVNEEYMDVDENELSSDSEITEQQGDLLYQFYFTVN
ncbi:hypothetical protein BDZ94DRAFT_1327628 [Collybia nuda]|uniref:Uncharacterized protein n=1 Tax=Collybia nuda TaxID=64659 RepID=A0A9P6CAS8_9AGAR|nr:hypothetical protein BDZ94DRAFT_1327628 [Collybia nuda]